MLCLQDFSNLLVLYLRRIEFSKKICYDFSRRFKYKSIKHRFMSYQMMLPTLEEPPNLEERVVPANLSKDFGMTNGFLKHFGVGRARYRGNDSQYDQHFVVLSRIFHGFYNVKIPNEMYQIMNPLEIVALWYGAGYAKESGLPGNEYIYSDFPTTVSKLVGLAFTQGPNIFGSIRGQIVHPHSTEKHSLVKRMMQFESAYPAEAEAFMKDYNAEFFYTRNIDPNRDGHSINLYLRDLKKLITKEYKKKAGSVSKQKQELKGNK